MTWLPEAQRPLSDFTGIDVNRPIWTRVGFEFTPLSDGNVTVGFSGPWEEVEPGLVWRQEVAIDLAETSGGAVGRRYRWETTDTLSGEPVWQGGEIERLEENVSERTFTTPAERLFIRVRWLLP